MTDYDTEKGLGLAAMDTLVAAVSTTTPIAGVVGAGGHLVDALVKRIEVFQLEKIDRFISNINSADEKCAEQFRALMFPEHRSRVSAERIIHNIFQMDIEEKVDYFSYAGISVSIPDVREIFTKADFFRAGMILALTLKEDIDFLHACNLDNPEVAFEYNENVQGLVSAGLMYPFDGEKYKFTTFAKKLDCFVLDSDGSKYGLEPQQTFQDLPVPSYKFHAYWA